MEDLERKLPGKLGAPGGFSNDWTIDPIKLACILRTADFAHLDDRRAPAFLRALRRPESNALNHWLFQERMYQPRLESDRLVYTAKRPFKKSEAAAWWVCYDTLRDLDHELILVDALLAETRRPRLAAKAVAYANDPKRLSFLISTEDWSPVDTQIKVGAVASLIRKLGGVELYGINYLVPLRELIQNSADAVRARRLLEDLPAEWGHIHVRAVTEGEHLWIEVSDTGVGMSSEVLTHALLDFGTTFWGSELMHTEFPGLESLPLEPTGKYGIGFFSIFMWGNQVEVYTRRYDRGFDDTKVLEFSEGLSGRPLLRPAAPHEQLRNGGTKVRVRLDRSISLETLLDNDRFRAPQSFSQICARLCATLDVTVRVQTGNEELNTVVNANDWLTMDGAALLQRIKRIVAPHYQPVIDDACDVIGPFLTVVTDTNQAVIGRACVVPSRYDLDPLPAPGFVTVGGFSSSEMTGIAGVLLGTPLSAARNSAVPLIDRGTLQEFASGGAQRIKHLLTQPIDAYRLALTVVRLGGDPGSLPVSLALIGWITLEEVHSYVQQFDTIVLIQDYTISSVTRYTDNFVLNPNVLTADAGGKIVLQGGLIEWPAKSTDRSYTILGRILNAIADVWDVPRGELLVSRNEEAEIGYLGQKPVLADAYIVDRKQVTTSE